MSFIPFHIIVLAELQTMSEYLKALEGFIQAEEQRLQEWYEGAVQSAQNQEELYELESFYGDVRAEQIQGFQQHWFASFIVSWYSFVEQKLLDLCVRLNLTISIGPLEEVDLKTGIYRAKRFLEKAANYKIPEPMWLELTRIGQMRNFIVHRGLKMRASLTGDSKMTKLGDATGGMVYFPIKPNLYQYLQARKMFRRNGVVAEIAPTAQFCKYLVSFGEKLFLQLTQDLGLS